MKRWASIFQPQSRIIQPRLLLDACAAWRWRLRLVSLPTPASWSEFATYRLFLPPPACGVKWMAPALTRYVYNATDPEALIKHLRELMTEPACRYITLHSQSSGRGLWDAKDVIPKVSALFTADA